MEKSERPKIKIKLKTLDWIIEFIGLILLIILIIVPIVFNNSLLIGIPIHTDTFGKLDSSGSPFDIFIFPAIGLILYIAFTIQNKFPHKYPYPVNVTIDNAERLYLISKRRSSIIKGLLMLFLIYKEIQPLLITHRIIDSNHFAILILIILFLIVHFLTNYQMKREK